MYEFITEKTIEFDNLKDPKFVQALLVRIRKELWNDMAVHSDYYDIDDFLTVYERPPDGVLKALHFVIRNTLFRYFKLHLIAEPLESV